MSTARETTSFDAATLDWLRDSGHPADSIEALTGDVSPRRYYRVHAPAGASAVLATYPATDQGACDRFLEVTGLLTERGVPVPAVLAADPARGLMLLQDLGDETLYTRRSAGWRYLAPRLEHAASLIPLIASLSRETVTRINPPLDRSLLGAELSKTWTVALGAPHLAEKGLPEALDSALSTMLDRLCEVPAVACHRDFMARNLMPAESGGVGRDPATGGTADAGPSALYVIDHQDLRMGPHVYDLASLLNDSLFAPAALEESLLARYLRTTDDRLAYHRAAAQRSLKIVGTYLAFAARGESRHLPLVEPSLQRARAHLATLPETEGLSTTIEALAEALLDAAARAGSGDRPTAR